MESNPNSLIENSYNQYDYSYMSGLSIPSTRPYEQIENELNKGIKFEEVYFKKKNNDKMIIYVLTKDKKRFISNEITFSKLKKRNNLRFEDIDTFINEINKINKSEIESEFSVYLEKMDIRIKYRYLQKNNNNVSIVFIAKDEKTMKNNKNNNNNNNNNINNNINDINDINNINDNNFDNNINKNNNINQINFDNNNNENKNILNNLKEEINKLTNSFLNLEENYKKREKLSNLNSYINTLKNSNQKIPSILYKKNSIITTVSKLLKKDQNKLDLELLFSLKRDGDNIEKFHELVNKIKPTLLFFELYDKQYYFYYINESWENENTNSDYQIKSNDKMFLYYFNHKEKYEKKKLAIYCCKNYGPMIGEFNENDVEFINNLDFDCSISLEKVFTSKKNIFTTANNFNQFYLKELEIYSLNIYN